MNDAAASASRHRDRYGAPHDASVGVRYDHDRQMASNPESRNEGHTNMSTSSNIPLFRPCSHRAQGFTFEHPADWQKVYSPRYVVYPADAQQVATPTMTMLSPCIAVIVASMELRGTRQAFYDEFISSHLSEAHGTLLQRATVSLGSGDEAVEYSYVVTNGSKKWQATRVVATKPGCHWNLWVVDASCLQENWVRWQSTLEKVVRSLRLL